MTSPTTSAPAVPAYRLLLPDGWEKLPADRAGVDALISRTGERFRDQHRPDLDAQMRTLLETAYRGMQKAGAFAIYLQTQAPEMAVPMSITASVTEDPYGGTLDRQVSGLFRDHGAGFLDDDRLIVRWEVAVGPRKAAERVAAHVVDYLIAVPGSDRRRALQLTTTIPLPENPDEGDRDVVARLVSLSDLITSTFTWEGTDR